MKCNKSNYQPICIQPLLRFGIRISDSDEGLPDTNVLLNVLELKLQDSVDLQDVTEYYSVLTIFYFRLCLCFFAGKHGPSQKMD